MLSQTGTRNYRIDEDPDFIHNYYERLVLQEIANTSVRVQSGDREFLADVACVALNRLPPRYIRHDVDMTFFMSPADMQEITLKVQHAVEAAIAYVESRENNDQDDLNEPKESSDLKMESAPDTKKSAKATADKKSGSRKSSAKSKPGKTRN